MGDPLKIIDFKEKSIHILDVFGAFLTMKVAVLSRISGNQIGFKHALIASVAFGAVSALTYRHIPCKIDLLCLCAVFRFCAGLSGRMELL